MDQRLQLANVALADLFEQPPNRALIGNAQPAGNPLQDPIGPEHHALTDAACTTHQADEHQKDGIDELVLRIVSTFVVHLAAEQSAKAQRIEELDHRDQPRLAGQVPPIGFVADVRRRFVRRLRPFRGRFAHVKGDSSG